VKAQGEFSPATLEGLVTSFAAGLCQTRPPEDLSDDSRRLWSAANDALRSPEVVSAVSGNIAGMEQCFLLAADSGRAYLSATDHGAGLYKLFEEFDVIPGYLSKKELKALFNLIVRAQTFHSGKQVKGPNGKDVISFVSFLKLLVMTCLHCLSKTSSFNSLYPTVKVMSMCIKIIFFLLLLHFILHRCCFFFFIYRRSWM
jgi:hypothetical protein